MKRHLQLAGLVACVAIVAAACSSGGASTAPSAAASAAATAAAPSTAASAPASAGASAAASGAALAYQGEITFWNTQRDIENVELQKEVQAWQALHPGITIKTDLVPFDGADKKYTDAANAGTAPDIMRADIGWTPTFADAGMLLDLTSLFPADFQKQFLPAPMGTAIYKGGMYGVPQVTDALGLQCNKTLLTTAGLSAAPTSWDELVSAGTKVTDLAAKKYGFYLNADSYWSQSYIWGWGGTLFTVNDQGLITNIGVNSPESVNGWTYLKTKILGTVAPATWDFKTSYDNMNAGFKAGTTMCIMQGPWQVADILTGTAFTDKSNLVIAPIPVGVNGKTGSPVGGHNWVVSVDVGKNADKAAAVASFLTFMTAPEQQAVLAKSLGLLPTNVAAYAVPDVASDPLINQWNAVLAAATNRAGVPGSSGIYDSFTKNFQSMIIGDLTPQAALDATANTWQTTVFKNQMAP